MDARSQNNACMPSLHSTNTDFNWSIDMFWIIFSAYLKWLKISPLSDFRIQLPLNHGNTWKTELFAFDRFRVEKLMRCNETNLAVSLLLFQYFYVIKRFRGQNRVIMYEHSEVNSENPEDNITRYWPNKLVNKATNNQLSVHRHLPPLIWLFFIMKHFSYFHSFFLSFYPHFSFFDN